MSRLPPGSASCLLFCMLTYLKGHCHCLLLRHQEACSSVIVAQSCPKLLFDPMNCSPPGSSAHEVLQSRILEWVSIPFSRGIFPTPGLNPGLPHCRLILYRLSHQGSLRRPNHKQLFFCVIKILILHSYL